ncbi:hypothetical protein RHMOL_Rhmol01G0096200 [Rhododendron molle]|uniref:Uncharacterized protein n=1 Tax=Rhododendron molle TaxID=49168 RepID=A0ACC0Q1J6_RHOML|nr:hypothetical protein RHMOL_Rhmol01G0096200 [Rhododendron molle]
MTGFTASPFLPERERGRRKKEEKKKKRKWKKNLGFDLDTLELKHRFVFTHFPILKGRFRIVTKFLHSEDTVSRHVHKILTCMRRGFTADKVKPTRRQDETHEYLNRHDFDKLFMGNCIRAIDETPSIQ